MNKIFLIACILTCHSIIGQVSINTSGGNKTDVGGSISYSIGQISYTYAKSNDGNISQGIQQTYDKSTLSTSEISSNLSLTVFPNPTTNNLEIQVDEYEGVKLLYQLLNADGALVVSGEINSKNTKLQTMDLPSSNYFVNISNSENQIIKSFKIIKN